MYVLRYTWASVNDTVRCACGTEHTLYKACIPLAKFRICWIQ